MFVTDYKYPIFLKASKFEPEKCTQYVILLKMLINRRIYFNEGQRLINTHLKIKKVQWPRQKPELEFIDISLNNLN